jgi:hypothetical protein
VQSFNEIKASRIVDVGMVEETIRKLNIFQGSKEVSVDRKVFKYNARYVQICSRKRRRQFFLEKIP